MRLLQKYIFFELLRVFVFVLSVLTFLLVFVGAFKKISENGLGPTEVLQILPYLVPGLLPFTIPATLLLTITVVYGRVAADHEVTAAKAAGISVLSLLWPSFIAGAVLSIVSLLLTDQVIPWATVNVERNIVQMMETIFLDMLHTQKLFKNPDHTITISVRDVDGKTLVEPVICFTPRGGDKITIRAKTATIGFDLEKWIVRVSLEQMDGVAPNRLNFRESHREIDFPIPQAPQQLRAQACSIHQLRNKLTGLTGTLEERRTVRDVETAFALATGDFERLDDQDLLQYEVDRQNNAEDIAKYRTEIHTRFALSASCFFFALVGGPFSILQARRAALVSFIMVFLPILLGYYPVVLFMMNLSKSETVNPAWAMWMGNVLLLPAAWITLRRVLRH